VYRLTVVAIGLASFVIGLVIGIMIVSAPKIKSCFRKRPKGFSEREMLENIRVKNMRPASSGDSYAETKTHLN